MLAPAPLSTKLENPMKMKEFVKKVIADQRIKTIKEKKKVKRARNNT